MSLLPPNDFDELIDSDADGHPAFVAFREAMKGRCYGHEALSSAWAWFKSGWEAGVNAAEVE